MKRKNFIGMLILMCLSLLIMGCNANNISGNTIVEKNTAVRGDIAIPLSDLSGQIKFYSYKDGGVNINYFAVLGSDGKPRVAFDACDVCGGYKGYEQQGTDIKCNNCGRVFSIDGLGTKNKGYGCWPSYLPHSVEGSNVLIKVSDLEAGKHRFV